MLKFEKVATPLAAGTASVPESVPPAGLEPKATVTVPVKLGTIFPNASRALTATGGVMVAPAVVLLGWPVNISAVTGPAVTVTAAVCVTVTPLIAAVTVFTPAEVELRLPVATPFASVAAAGWVSAFPVLPPSAQHARLTAAPLIALPNASRAVTVKVATFAPVDAGIEVGAATNVDCVAETAAGVMAKAALAGPASVPDVATRV